MRAAAEWMQAARARLERRGGLVETAEQQQPARSDEASLQRVGVVGARFERGGGDHEWTRRAAEVTHASATSASATTQRARAISSCVPKRARGRRAAARPRVLAELRHRDAAQRKRRRIVAQRDALERAERVASAEGARGSSDQGVHCKSLLCVAGPNGHGLGTTCR
jgi:hypothetical protein